MNKELTTTTDYSLLVSKLCSPLNDLFDHVNTRHSGYIYVAGGAMRSIYNTSYGERDPVKDYDVYCKDKRMYEIALDFCSKRYKVSPQHPNSKNIAFTIASGIPDVQLISEYFYGEGPVEIFKNFDWTCVMSAYNGQIVHSHASFDEDNDNRVLRLPYEVSHYIDKGRGPAQLLSRAMKYAAKGYYLPTETIDKITQIIRQYPDPSNESYLSRMNS